MKRPLLILIALCVAAPVYAGKCMWVTTPTNITLGNYSVFGSSSLVATSSYTFRCNPNTNGTLTFSTGSNSATYFPRQMANGANRLGYNVYDDAATTIVIGDGSGGTTSRVVFNSTPQDKDYTDIVYGKVVEGSDVAAGTYTDTVTAFLSWGNGSASATFQVTVVVVPECTISAAALNFGAYDPVVANAATPLDSTSGVDVYCTKGTASTIGLGNGLNFAGGTRRLRSAGGSLLDYGLFTNSARSTAWLSAAPNVVSGTSTSKLTPVGNGLVVYGRVAAGQDPTAGVHSDTVQATVNY